MAKEKLSSLWSSVLEGEDKVALLRKVNRMLKEGKGVKPLMYRLVKGSAPAVAEMVREGATYDLQFQTVVLLYGTVPVGGPDALGIFTEKEFALFKGISSSRFNRGCRELVYEMSRANPNMATLRVRGIRHGGVEVHTSTPYLDIGRTFLLFYFNNGKEDIEVVVNVRSVKDIAIGEEVTILFNSDITLTTHMGREVVIEVEAADRERLAHGRRLLSAAVPSLRCSGAGRAIAPIKIVRSRERASQKSTEAEKAEEPSPCNAGISGHSEEERAGENEREEALSSCAAEDENLPPAEEVLPIESADFHSPFEAVSGTDNPAASDVMETQSLSSPPLPSLSPSPPPSQAAETISEEKGVSEEKASMEETPAEKMPVKGARLEGVYRALYKNHKEICRSVIKGYLAKKRRAIYRLQEEVRKYRRKE